MSSAWPRHGSTPTSNIGQRHRTKVEQRLPNVNDWYNGLVFLFSLETDAPLMIFPDGLIQPYHVARGVTTGAKRLIADSTTLSIYGVPDIRLRLIPRTCTNVRP